MNAGVSGGVAVPGGNRGSRGSNDACSVEGVGGGGVRVVVVAAVLLVVVSSENGNFI